MPRVRPTTTAHHRSTRVGNTARLTVTASPVSRTPTARGERAVRGAISTSICALAKTTPSAESRWRAATSSAPRKRLESEASSSGPSSPWVSVDLARQAGAAGSSPTRRSGWCCPGRCCARCGGPSRAKRKTFLHGSSRGPLGPSAHISARWGTLQASLGVPECRCGCSRVWRPDAASRQPGPAVVSAGFRCSPRGHRTGLDR
jgi:hypothetical protein